MVRNVLVVCLDSVRKDYFDEYAVRLQDRAAVSFDGMRAASSWSSPSHASMMTGALPSEHHVHAEHNDFSELDPTDTVAGDLTQHHSIGVSANVFASSKYGFDLLFDEFHEVSTGRRFIDGLDANEFFLNHDGGGPRVGLDYLRACLRSDAPLESFANGILAGINVGSRNAPVPKVLDDGASAMSRTIRRSLEETTDPVFLFANYTDAHIPLRPILQFDRSLYSAPFGWSTDRQDVWDVVADPDSHEEYLTYFRELYGAAIDYLDRQLVSLLDEVEHLTDRETTVIITADHGENLGFDADERLIGHKSSLSESLLHVPFLLVNPPDGYEATEPGYSSHLDLRSLVVGLSRDETPDVFHDRIPAEVVGMSPGPDPDDDYEYWNRAMRCVYEGTTKTVWDSMGTVEAFTIDPTRPCWQELRDESGSIPPWADEFFTTDITAYKQEQQRRSVEAGDVDEFTRQRLQDLGYM